MKDNKVTSRGIKTIRYGHPRTAGNGKCQYVVDVSKRGKPIVCGKDCACAGTMHTSCRCSEHVGVKPQAT